MEINIAYTVIWFNSEIDTYFKTYIVYHIEIPSYLHIVASLVWQFFFQDLKYCNGQLEWWINSTNYQSIIKLVFQEKITRLWTYLRSFVIQSMKRLYFTV